MRGWVKKEKGLGSTNWRLQSSHGDVINREYNHRYCNNYVLCQVGAILILAITSKVT